MTTLDAALSYIARGWSPIPVPYRDKNPGAPGENLRITAQEAPRFFNSKPQNIGVLLGEPSHSLIDVDLDHPAALKLASEHLPETPAVFGRPGNPRSHRLYRASGPVETEQLYLPGTMTMVVELRSTGGQTVFPPSTHPSGERIEWIDGGAEPAIVAPEALRLAVHSLYAATLFELGVVPKADEPQPEKGAGDGDRPGDEYTRRTTWPELLVACGWSIHHESGGVVYWHVPGSENPWGATTNFGGSDLLYTFTPRTGLEPRKAFSRFAAYTNWEHGGDFRAAAKALAAQGFGPKGNTRAPERDEPEPICNAIVVKTEEETVTEPICMELILDRIRRRTEGWPRRVGTALFDHKAGGAVEWLTSPAALFGWLGSTCPPPARFSKSIGCHSREDVFRELQRTSKPYLAVETTPHEPLLPDHYYACTVPTPGNGDALRGLVERFGPATPIDADLITAAFVTPCWGGSGGMRPAFTITSDDGRGAGKTAVAAMISYTWGGAVELSANESAEIIKQRLLSPVGLTKRIAVLDNVKTLRFSWAELESLITTPVISGKQMFVGEGTRPNNLFWVITLNGASYSTDMAQRSVFVKIRKPKHSGSWADDTREYIDRHRQQIIADAIGFLRTRVPPLARHSRWGAWERDVLARLPEPSDAQKVILERQQVADVEVEEADIVEDYFRHKLVELRYDADVDRVFLPSNVVCLWFNAATNERHTSTAVSRTINQRINEGKFHSLTENKCKTWGRGFVWVGSAWDCESHTKTDVETRLDEMDRPKDRRGY